MKYVRGDLIQMGVDNVFDIIGHGCNIHNVQNSGFALYLRNAFPEAYKADCKTIKGDREKIGTYSSCMITQLRYFGCTSEIIILNCYTQFTYWDPNDMFSYEGLENVLIKIKEDFAEWFKNDAKIGFPLIGAGLAQGDWKRIKAIFDKVDIPNCYIVVKFDADWMQIVAPTWDNNDIIVNL